MQLRSIVTASVLHGALIVGVGLGVQSWRPVQDPPPEIHFVPAAMAIEVAEDTPIDEPVEAVAELTDTEFIEPDFLPPPAPSPDPSSEAKPEAERDLHEPVYSSPNLTKASPQLLIRIRPAVLPEPAVEPALSIAATDAVALEDENLPPEYPAQAVRRGVEGTVVLLVTVDVKGEVARVDLLQSAGLTRWHRLLDKAAINAIGQWRYRPATQNGKPVEKRIKQPVVFRYPR